MPVSKEIVNISVMDEFRVCPSCGYERGFHTSFIKSEAKEEFNVILICPGCGSRFNIGWKIAL